ncbi:hypothetical protein GCM10007301_32790 [Azorhizobium oxalatiphilum]|uniref:Uncharacterized protein n=1 Tax=Azorhizobium oxalatiphilum TaxID=980631 RepID=A0A917C4Z6_9HYPH|nr:hypothetical protein [Azorhizobium oxalatiphilum]GGF70445.1 hypothetical protein GCM10007301_32790 [Azorhizobium oxalatiphilum]
MTSFFKPFFDDQQQNRQDRTRPPELAPKAKFSQGEDQSRHHQGAGPTGEYGGDRPAENDGSALAMFDGRERLPGTPKGRAEPYWDTPLPQPVTLSYPAGRRLETLADAGTFLSSGDSSLVHSLALQVTGRALADAAATGDPADVAQAGELLGHYLSAVRLM